MYGLFLEGASWDSRKGVLREGLPKELFAEMPVLWLQPRTGPVVCDELTYDAPCYRTPLRQAVGRSGNFVMHVRLRSEVPAAHWVRRGAALLLGLDE